MYVRPFRVWHVNSRRAMHPRSCGAEHGSVHHGAFVIVVVGCCSGCCCGCCALQFGAGTHLYVVAVDPAMLLVSDRHSAIACTDAERDAPVLDTSTRHTPCAYTDPPTHPPRVSSQRTNMTSTFDLMLLAVLGDATCLLSLSHFSDHAAAVFQRTPHCPRVHSP